MTDEYLSQSVPTKTTVFDEPLTATFWRQGDFIKFKCIDCVVNTGPNYTEVVLRAEDETNNMFLITADPEITAQMNDHIFDGFQLRRANGTVIEQITVTDNQTRH